MFFVFGLGPRPHFILAARLPGLMLERLKLFSFGHAKKIRISARR
jgi:hypothetical protein